MIREQRAAAIIVLKEMEMQMKANGEEVDEQEQVRWAKFYGERQVGTGEMYRIPRVTYPRYRVRWPTPSSALPQLK